MRVRRLAALMLTLLLAGWLIPAHGLAKDYRIDKVSIDARILEDGSVKIVERRVYSFQGEFHWASYRLPLQGIGRVDSFQVREAERIYRPDESERDGTVRITISRDRLEAKWFFTARNQTRVFILSFVLRDVVRVYTDVAEFYYKFVGEGWDKPTGRVIVRVSWEHPANPDSIRVWAHGPLWGRSRILPDGRVELTVSPLPAHTFWEGRILFPPSWVPKATNRLNTAALQRILAQEAEWARQANRKRQEALRKAAARRERERQGLWFLSFLSLAAVAIVANWWARYGRRHPTPGVPKMDSTLPSDRPPALVAYLLGKGSLGGAVLTATLLDLARRGWLRIEPREEIRGKLWKRKRVVYTFVRQQNPDGDTLRPWEEELLRFLFDEIGQGTGQVTDRQIKKASGKVRRWYRKWQKQLSQLAKQEHFFEEPSLKARNKAIVLSVVLSLLGVGGLFVSGWPGIIPIIVGSLLLIPAMLMPRRTPEAEMEAQRWLALGRYLRKYGKAGGQLSGDLELDTLLPYAIVLGVSKKALVRLAEA
ncbi:MAG: DUF2207 domain-containing protein, partial [Calditrichaeota bacterium]|nr:DUF2207 domain-containing protein [Calditrichota bacterium]